MFPGMNERAMKAAMRKMGVQQEPVDAEEVVIRLRGGRELVVRNPSVAKVSMMGQETFQVSGEYSEQDSSSAQQQVFNEEDVKTVIEQTGAGEPEAKAALARLNGDLAAAILFLKEKNSD